jgi:hypothetical protein
MPNLGKSRWFVLGVLLVVSLGATAPPVTVAVRPGSATLPIVVRSGVHTPAPRAPGDYVILAWNNLGMHCYDSDFSDFAVLPPYNTLRAQVIRIGDPPQLVTEGITVWYEFPDNTYSVDHRGLPDKTNFWDYAQALFDLPQPLPHNVGLAGKGLSGTMDLDAQTGYFEALGIPLTWYRDQDAANQHPYPFQLAHITVTQAGAPNNSRSVLAELTVVAPVSTEISCANCHCDDCDATTAYPIVPTGNVKQNILTLHDYLNQGAYDTPLMEQRPVLCAGCHASAALGTTGMEGVKSLSNAMHFHHKDLPDITPDSDGCYNCHPGPETQCLRDTMSQNFSANCTNCHGLMAEVAQNPQPWLQEPQCSNGGCHGAGYAPDQALFQYSRGHGGIYCSGCHDSPHAYSPGRESNDGIKFMQLQGHLGSLSDCTVCHATKPDQMFKHSF